MICPSHNLSERIKNLSTLVVTSHKTLTGMWTKILPDIASIHMKETKKTYWIQIQIKRREEETNEIADTLFTASFSTQ